VAGSTLERRRAVRQTGSRRGCEHRSSAGCRRTCSGIGVGRS
jgi:hypothetical protein